MAALVLDGTANPEGPGLLLRGREYEPLLRSDFDPPGVGRFVDLDPLVIAALVRIARVAGAIGDALRDYPDPAVRRSAAILAARAHPLRAALDD